MSAVSEAKNSYGMDEIAFKEYLVGIACADLARQIEVRVKDVATMSTVSVNGHTNSTYQSQTEFATNVRLKLVQTKSVYSHTLYKGYAIAYIDKALARDVYKRDLNRVMSRIDNAISTARSYVGTGFNSRAEQELMTILPLFDDIDDALFALTFFGNSQSEADQMQQRANRQSQAVKQMLADLKHATVIYVGGSAKLFNSSYPNLVGEIQGVLSREGCSFANDASRADYTILVDCSAREYAHSNIGATTTYFAYVDASITITKAVTAQQIYNNVVSVKGGSTIDYSAAARVAYKKISQSVANEIKNNIEL